MSRKLFFDAAEKGNLQRYEMYAPHASDENVIESLDKWMTYRDDPRVIDYVHRTRSDALANHHRNVVGFALRHGRPEILRRLARYYPDILTANYRPSWIPEEKPGHYSIMHASSDFGSNKSLGALLNMAPNLVKSVDHRGHTPVHTYLTFQNHPTAHILNRMHAADPHAFSRRTRENGETPLHIATSRQHLDAVKTMVHKMNKSNRLATNGDGKTAWNRALKQRHHAINGYSQYRSIPTFQRKRHKIAGNIAKALAYKDPELIETPSKPPLPTRADTGIFTRSKAEEHAKDIVAVVKKRIKVQKLRKQIPESLLSLEPRRQLEVAKVFKRHDVPLDVGKKILGHLGNAGEWDKMWYHLPSTNTAKPTFRPGSIRTKYHLRTRK